MFTLRVSQAYGTTLLQPCLIPGRLTDWIHMLLGKVLYTYTSHNIPACSLTNILPPAIRGSLSFVHLKSTGFSQEGLTELPLSLDAVAKQFDLDIHYHKPAIALQSTSGNTGHGLNDQGAGEVSGDGEFAEERELDATDEDNDVTMALD
ncbi:unnamed protein product [Protopolystoma xenopodis]|uniref:Uncharacterized protein n=1 Tax=Protopolystoma xenopodis TaxID=117903 RepID=A0A3S5FGT4_9PLAT|nr:unnamed protein product [Protopolystoma xenopodis]